MMVTPLASDLMPSDKANNNNNNISSHTNQNVNDNDVHVDAKTNGSAAALGLLRSISVPNGTAAAAAAANDALGSGSKVSVHRADDDETFASFFSSNRNHTASPDAGQEVQIADFDAVLSTQRLVQKRTVQGPKNRRATANPLKALAARRDLQTEYTEIRTGIADKELRRLKLESSE